LETLTVSSIPASSQLPSQLEALNCSICPFVQPLLGLQQLQQLTISYCDTPADELRQLSNLRSLTDIELCYTGDDAATSVSNSAAAWSAIAPKVKEMVLEFDRCYTSTLGGSVTFLQQLSCLTAVTRLGLGVTVGPLPGTATEMAGVLLNLQQLQILEISTNTSQTPMFMPAAEAAAMVAAQQAAAVVAAQQAAAVVAAQQAAAVMAAQQAEVAEEAAIAAAENNAPNAAEAAEAAAMEAGAAQVAALAAWQVIGAAAAAAGDVQAGADAAGENAAPVFGVDGGGGDGGEAAEVAAAAAAAGSAVHQLVPLTRAIAQLPQLVSLKLRGAGTTVEAVEAITGLTRLTRLAISGLGFDDAALISLACGLTGLRRLSLSSANVTDASLMAVARMLQQLTAWSFQTLQAAPMLLTGV
jgi:hypothetical protein